MRSIKGKVDDNWQAKCGRCSKNARLQGIEYCTRCLIKIVEKRARDSLKTAIDMANRQGKQKQPSPRIVIMCDEKLSLAGASAVYLAKKILGTTFAISTIAAKPRDGIKGGIFIYAQCLDDIAAGLILEFINGPKNRKRSSTLSRNFNIFESITENELRLYAGMKRIKYAQLQGNWLKHAIRELQEKHPGTVEAIARSAARLHKIEAQGKK